MSSFNFSDYDYEDDILPVVKPKPTQQKQPIKQNTSFDFDLYDDAPPEEKPYSLQYAQYTPSQYEKLSPEKKKELQEYSPLKGLAKGVAKGVSLGASEMIPGLEIQEHEVGAGPGEFLGVVAPISLAAKAISYPFKALQGLTNFGKVGQAVTRTAQSASTGALYGAGKETIEAVKGNEFIPGNVAKEAALFGILHGAFESGTGAYQWLKSLRPAQQSELLVKGVIPENMTPNQYKFYQDEIIPELQARGKSEYEQAYKTAIEENNKLFEQEMANTQAAHENELYKKAQDKKLSAEEFAEDQKRYESKVKQIAAEHEAKVAEIEKQNQEAIQEFEQQQKDFDTLKKRDAAVRSAIQPTVSPQTSLQGRVTNQAPDIGYRPSAPYQVNPTLKNRVGNIISPNEITNTTAAGRANIEAVRANDAIDYAIVRDAYTQSEQLNSQVNATQANLVQELRTTADHIRSIPEPSPPQRQLLNTIDQILRKTEIVNEAGEVIGLQEINNRTLQEQAKALRYYMDFNFEHGNSRGIFSPTVRQLENAIESGARSVGNEAAVESNQTARRLYSEWAETYDNPYIRPYRDTSNLDFSKTFKSSLDTDNFNVLNNVLNRSNAGQQLANSTRRELVDTKLSKFFDNPNTYDRVEFDKALRELDPVISPEQSRGIRTAFDDARRTPVITGKKVTKTEAPEKPKIKELPRAKIPAFTKKPRQVSEITEVKVPTKKQNIDTPEMREAARKMNITKEEVMKKTNTTTGLKQIKDELSPQLSKRLGQNKVKEILYEGNVERKFTGDELFNIINKGNNYDLLAEILGEDVTADLLINSKEIAKKRITVNAFKKLGANISTLKTLALFGII